MAHHPVSLDASQRFEFSAKAQSRLIMFIITGIVAVALGCFLMASGIGQGHHEDGHGKAEDHATAVQHSVDAAHGDASHNHQAAAGAHDHATGHDAEVSHTGENMGAAASSHETHNVAATDGAEAAMADGHGHGHAAKTWWDRLIANLWLDSVFFTGLSVIGIFFVAVQYCATAGWSSGLIRVPMALGSFLPFALGLLLITFLLGNHTLFHWTHEGLYVKGGPEYDAILDGKKGYLNVPFFLGRLVVFGGLWVGFNTLIRKRSLREDAEGGTKIYDGQIKFSAIFLVIFAVSSSMLAWDWVMSIEPHWYSTLFGWYMFASWHVSGIAVIALTTVFLKEKGLLSHVNSNHLHDLGKFMFAFSIFWTYLWLSQYLLIWYANIPEEAIYFIERVRGFNGHYTGVFFINLLINFVFPFLVLMTRDAKRTPIFLKVVGFAILGGHWLDFYQMVMPATLGESAGFGFIEFGMLTVFVSAFILVVSKTIASAPLVAKNHPMLQESLHHDI